MALIKNLQLFTFNDTMWRGKCVANVGNNRTLSLTHDPFSKRPMLEFTLHGHIVATAESLVRHDRKERIAGLKTLIRNRVPLGSLV